MKSDSAREKHKLPYIYDYYDIRCFTTNPLSLTKSVLARLPNALIKALNESTTIPRFIVVVPDLDVVHFIRKYKAGISTMACAAINWIANQMIRAILAKKEFMRALKPGSITHYKPKYIWIKALEVPDNLYKATMARKFNKCLDKVLVEKDSHYIIDVNEKIDGPSFFMNSQLNGSGRVNFWTFIDSQIENFDYRRETLKPRNSAIVEGEQKKNDMDQESRTSAAA